MYGFERSFLKKKKELVIFEYRKFIILKRGTRTVFNSFYISLLLYKDEKKKINFINLFINITFVFDLR